MRTIIAHAAGLVVAVLVVGISVAMAAGLFGFQPVGNPMITHLVIRDDSPNTLAFWTALVVGAVAALWAYSITVRVVR